MENWFRILQIASIIIRPYGDGSINLFLGMLAQVSIIDALKLNVNEADYGYILPRVQGTLPNILLPNYEPSNNDTLNISNMLIPHLVMLTDGRPNSTLVKGEDGNLMRITYVRPSQSDIDRRELFGRLVPSRPRNTHVGPLQKPTWRANSYAAKMTSRDLLKAFPNGIDHEPDSALIKKNSSKIDDFTYWAFNRYIQEWILIPHENVIGHYKIKGSMVLSESEFTPLLDEYDQPVYTQYGGGNPRLKLANTLDNKNAYGRSLALSLTRYPIYRGFYNDYTESNTVGTFRLSQHEQLNEPPPSLCVHLWDATNRRVFVVNNTGPQKKFISVFNFYGLNKMDQDREKAFLTRGDVYR